jgi:hypothetical protein
MFESTHFCNLFLHATVPLNEKFHYALCIQPFHGTLKYPCDFMTNVYGTYSLNLSKIGRNSNNNNNNIARVQDKSPYL